VVFINRDEETFSRLGWKDEKWTSTKKELHRLGK